MIAANKNDVLDSFLYLYFRWLARRSFHLVATRGLENLRNLPADRPVLLFCNHTNWWDGLMLYLLTRQIRKACYCMMEEQQLKHYRFFAWLGAFSVDLSSPIRSAASLRYAQRLLQKEDTAIFIFPQGRISRPNEPIQARPGTDYLAKTATRSVLIPVAMSYGFFREDRPNVLIEIGAAFPSIECTEGRIERECNAMAARAAAALAAQDLTGFTPLFLPRLALNKRWEWIKLLVSGRRREFTAAN
jgi:1-acyl-sn-glycerol-3-phosphate acyltransferase